MVELMCLSHWQQIPYWAVRYRDRKRPTRLQRHIVSLFLQAYLSSSPPPRHLLSSLSFCSLFKKQLWSTSSDHQISCPAFERHLGESWSKEMGINMQRVSDILMSIVNGQMIFQFPTASNPISGIQSDAGGRVETRTTSQDFHQWVLTLQNERWA
jgi:hypothetical protein